MRPLPKTVVMLLLGTVSVCLDNPVFIVVAGILLIISLKIELNNKKRAFRLFVFYSLVFILGILRSLSQEKEYLGVKEYLTVNETVTVTGVVSEKEYKNERYRMYLDSGFLVFSDEEGPEVGTLIRVKGKPMEPMVSENEGGFDYESYLKGRGICGVITGKEITTVSPAITPIPEFMYRLRMAITGFFGENLPGEEGGLLSAMVIGNKAELDDEAKELFQRAGLSHILAISGLHLSIVGMLLYKILRRMSLGFVLSGILAGTVVVFYGMLCGNPISMVRAIGMFIVLCGANISGRGYDPINSLSLVGILLLLQNPYIIYSAGFIMSFSAILGISLVASPLQNMYKDYCKLRWELNSQGIQKEKYKPKPMEKLAASLISGAAIGLFSYPILAYFFNGIPVYVLFLNMVVLPILPVLILSGLISGLLFIPIILFICHFILYFYEMAADFVSSLPGAYMIVPTPSWYTFIIYYILLFFLLFIFLRFKNKDYYEELSLLENNKKLIAKGLTKTIRKKLIIIGLAIVGFLFILSLGNKNDFRIDMLSVGQGDGIYIESKEGVKFFIDGGSSSEKELAKYTLSPYFKSFGIKNIDYWIISHPDSDHCNGLIELLEEGFPVGNIVFAKSVEREENYKKIEALASNNGVVLAFVKPGDTLGTKSFKIEVLYPDYPGKEKGVNENSLVFLAEYGDFQAIFTGDMGIDQEKELLKNPGFLSIIENKDIEVLKLAHHGSKNSSCIEWLEAINPEAVIISAGQNNRYGHPAKETIERLESAKIPYYSTIESGRIRITYKNGRMIINEYKKTA